MPDRVYVFDMDDTLYLERDYVRSGFRHIGDIAVARYGVNGAGEFAWALFEDGVRGNTFDLVTERFDLPPEATEALIDEYRNHEPAISLAQDAAAFLADLPSDAVGTGLITDGYGPGQRKKIHALGLETKLDILVVTAEHDAGWAKPGERAFRAIQDEYARGGVEFVYFGDNPRKDFIAPRALGWRSVRVRRPQGLHEGIDDDAAVDVTILEFPASGVSDMLDGNPEQLRGTGEES